jgi:hypothetical protein
MSSTLTDKGSPLGLIHTPIHTAESKHARTIFVVLIHPKQHKDLLGIYKYFDGMRINKMATLSQLRRRQLGSYRRRWVHNIEMC